ncbi:protein YgfX [Thalassotalea sp. G2M2-11]|uniref:protein YgfX n=1 Tax=Thalassotalea sp. G2M2-11 TaxID=2787627 RepID=UPI0019CF89EE|nr:protein YgfX [Thalassotalea sp. G2M2-11]
MLLICSLTLIAVWPIIGALTSATLLLGYLLLYWSDKYNKPSCFAAHTITLADNGVLVFDQQSSYQLLPNSRIGWLGCWLNLQSQQAECIGKTEQRFLAKQQFNAQDYARLSRFILRYNSVRSVE